MFGNRQLIRLFALNESVWELGASQTETIVVANPTYQNISGPASLQLLNMILITVVNSKGAESNIWAVEAFG
jgi:hypothetical protein